MANNRNLGLDDLDEESGPFDWYNNNAKLINALLITALLAFVGYQLYTRWHDSKVESANQAISPVMSGYAKAFHETDAQKRRTELGNLSPQALAVATQHADREIANDARLLAANAIYYQASSMLGAGAADNFKQAQQRYQEFISSATNNRARAVGQLGLANTLENLAFLTADQAEQGRMIREATAAYDQVSSLAPGSYLAAEAQMGRARMLSATAGGQSEARKQFETVMNSRAIPTPSTEDRETTLTTANGEEISPEKIRELRAMENLSYHTAAERSIARLQSLPTTATQTMADLVTTGTQTGTGETTDTTAAAPAAE